MKMLRLKKKNSTKIRFAGSFIQQNHGEPLKGHGYSLWDLNDYSYEHHEVTNKYGYFTVDINKGNLVTDISDMPPKVHLRLRCYESISSEVKTIISRIKEHAEIIEIAYVRMEQEKEETDVLSLGKDIVLTDLTDIDYQNKLIQEFIKQKFPDVDQKKMDHILKINRETNSLIKKDEFARNLKWKPIKFEWDNMFTYGEGNSIDFTQMEGVYGIFGPNRSGKSSILSAIIFCLFDKFDRGYKGSHVLNVQKTSFRCKLELEISGISYFIERKGTSGRTGNVKVDVRFWKKLDDGTEEDLHGTARRDTNDIVRDYIGTYEDFILTAASFQTAKNNSSFIDMGNSDRKDLLVQFIGLNIFDRLYESAGERNKELNTILKLHKDKNYTHEKQQNQNALDHATSLFIQLNSEIEKLKKQIKEVNEQIVTETSNLIKLDDNVPIDINKLNNQKESCETLILQKRASIDGYKSSSEKSEHLLSEVNEKISKIESSNLVESHKTYKTITDKINNVNQKIDLKKIEVRSKLDKVKRLDQYKYNPECEFCTNNEFVKDAVKAKSELENDKKEADTFIVTMDDLKIEFDKFKWVEQAYEIYTKLLNERSKIKDEYGIISSNIFVSVNELEKLKEKLKIYIQQIELYHRNEVSVENNLKVQSKISSYRNTLLKLDSEFQKQNSLLMDISGKKEIFGNQIKRLSETIEEVQKLELESEVYQLYRTSVGRDGIPYQVICNTVPDIETEVNSILSQVVDFTVQFETDGNNIVPYIVYNDKQKWAIELSSGFERFVTSIAIRVALTNVSNLPRCNFLFIDEGFGTLDSNNIASMPLLFSCLKNSFDFIIIISHLDMLKDSVEKQIEIQYEGNLSKVISA